MTKDIFKNYEAFYNMVLSTTIMSNAQTVELETDQNRIIDFIGKAYKFKKPFIDECRNIIINKLSKVVRSIDQHATYLGRNFDDEYSDDDSLLDIKGDVIATLEEIGDEQNCFIHKGWFDYSHYKTYQADVRFSKINITSSSGDLITTRQTGILEALGIGCKKDYDKAIYRLTQCAFWGDIPSMYYLGYTNKLNNNLELSEVYYDLAYLAKEYLYTGITVLPADVKKVHLPKAVLFYTYISSILQDIIYRRKESNINRSFLEALSSPGLDYYKRMNLINNYYEEDWKEITNTSIKPIKFGFTNKEE